MTREEINYYNRRCAEFLNIQKGFFDDEIDCPIPKYQWMCVSANCSYQIEKEDNVGKTVYDYLKFHSDWNWIMEVKQQIISMGYYWFQFPNIIQINQNGTISSSKIVNFQFDKLKEKEAVVQAINQFLIWYNNENA